jgi:hypothetical protein
MRPESAAGIESGVASLPRGLNELRKTITARVGGDDVVLPPDGVHKALERVHRNLLAHSVNHEDGLHGALRCGVLQIGQFRSPKCATLCERIDPKD